MKIGDKVRFLFETGGGIVKGFQGKDIVLVEDENGFSIPMLIRECVVIDTNEYNFEKKTVAPKKEEPKKPEVKLDTVVSAPQSQPELLVESQVLADSTQQETITPKDSLLVFTEEQQAAMDEPIQPEKGYSNSPSIPVFSIQIVAVSAELKLDDERLKGLSPVTFVKSGNMYKGLYGGTTQYKKARETLAAIREKFPDAFIVAYLGEEPITTARALEISGQ